MHPLRRAPANRSHVVVQHNSTKKSINSKPNANITTNANATINATTNTNTTTTTIINTNTNKLIHEKTTQRPMSGRFVLRCLTLFFVILMMFLFSIVVLQKNGTIGYGLYNDVQNHELQQQEQQEEREQQEQQEQQEQLHEEETKRQREQIIRKNPNQSNTRDVTTGTIQKNHDKSRNSIATRLQDAFEQKQKEKQQQPQQQQQQQQQLHYSYTPMSDWIQTDLNSLLYFNQYTNITDLLEGRYRGTDRLLLWNNNHTTSSSIPSSMSISTGNDYYGDDDACCEFRLLMYSRHFPHVMQQLYRCWSWWYMNINKNKKPILYWKNHNKYMSDYVIQFLHVLQEQINLTITDTYDKPCVRAKDTGRWQKDTIEVTDFAFLTTTNTNNHNSSISASTITSSSHAMALRELFVPYAATATATASSNNKTFNPAGCDQKYKKSNGRDTPARSLTTVHPRITILNRSTKSKRNIINGNELYESIQKQFPTNLVSISYFDNKTYYEQVQFFMESDIVITPHGSQLTGIVFLPQPCSHVIEFMPPDYYVIDYFASLAKAVGIGHSFFYMMKTTNKNKRTSASSSSRTDGFNKNKNKNSNNNNNYGNHNSNTNTATTYSSKVIGKSTNNRRMALEEPYEEQQDHLLEQIPYKERYHYLKSTLHRDDPMYIDPSKVVRALQTIVQDWEQCCRHGPIRRNYLHHHE